MDSAQLKPKSPPRATPRDPGELEVARAKIHLTCCYCHDSDAREALAYCAGCLAPHHMECFEEHGGCTALGCGVQDVVRPQRGVASRPQPPLGRGEAKPGIDPWGLAKALGLFALGGLLCLGFVFLLGASISV